MQHFKWDDHIWPFCTHKSQNPVIPHNNLWSAIYERPLPEAGGRSTTVLHRYGWSLGAVHLYSPHQLHAIDQDPMGVGCTSVTVGQYCPTHDMNMLHAYPHWSLTRQGYQLTKTVQQGGVQPIHLKLCILKIRWFVVLKHSSFPFNIWAGVVSPFETGILKDFV